MSSTTEPLVSILTPVYNGAAYLEECIQAVLAQTYSRFEYILVNNCSTDDTLKIAEHYARRDPRMRIHNNARFVGVIENHNIALTHISADSKYYKFAHADDFLFPECVARMVQVAEAHPSVGLVSAYRLEGETVSLDGLPYPSTVVPGHAIIRAALLGKLRVFGSFNSTLIRTELVNTRVPFYVESNLHADTEACYELLRRSDFGFVHQVLTFTRTHKNSVTSSVEHMNSYLVTAATMLHKYGPLVLTAAEIEARRKELMKHYYEVLGKSLLKRCDRAFWRYHREGLQRCGWPLSRSRILAAALIEGVKLCCDVPRLRRVLGARFAGDPA